ncbi:MAG TPA: hypothetical protein VJX67_03910 [Blastocatellia bacterium]|nr:hypothetical protein [Blastocatellia bacterium]
MTILLSLRFVQARHGAVAQERRLLEDELLDREGLLVLKPRPRLDIAANLGSSMNRKQVTKQTKRRGRAAAEGKRTPPTRGVPGDNPLDGGWRTAKVNREFGGGRPIRETADRPGLEMVGTERVWMERIELTDEQADRVVTQALDCEVDEPEPLVKVLLFLFDLQEQGRGPELSDSLLQLMAAAYNNSVVHSANFHEYLDAIRQGRDPVKRARRRMARG